MIVVRRVIKSNRGADFSLAQFDLFDWVGNKFVNKVESVAKKHQESPRYYQDPEFRQRVNTMFQDVDDLRPDARKVGKALVGVGAAGVVGLGAIGAGIYYLRRRKSKNGKQIVERVRR